MLNLIFQPLFADGIGDVIGLIIWVVIIGFSILSKVLKSGGGNKKQVRPPQRQPRAQQPGPGPAARPQAGRGIDAEIEDFLRQARGGKKQTPPQQPAARQAPVRQQPRRVVEAQPVEADIVPGQGFGRELKEHVADHIGRDSISTRDAHLGDHIEMADERIEHHLEEVFDHDVGHIAHADPVDTSVSEGTDAHSWEEKNVEKVDSAAKIRKMLSTPESVREVFIISEILKRPEI